MDLRAADHGNKKRAAASCAVTLWIIPNENLCIED